MTKTLKETLIKSKVIQGKEFDIINSNYQTIKSKVKYMDYVNLILDSYNFYIKQRNIPKFEAKFLTLYDSITK